MCYIIRITNKDKPAGNPCNNRRYGLKNLDDCSSVEHITWHDLQRTHGCGMLQEVGQLMGHSTVTVTEKNYAFLNVHKIQKKLRRGFHKLIKKKEMLLELVERMDSKHPLAALFLGIIRGETTQSR
jgi:integrase